VTLDRRLCVVAVVAMLVLAERALAQSPSSEPPPRWIPLSRFGMTLGAGGGVTDFTDSGTRTVTGAGGTWNFRLAFRTRRVLGAEVSYVGGANPIRGFEPSDAKLIRNGLEAALRVNVPLYAGDTLLEPYFAGGMGWNGYRVTNATAANASVSPAGTDTLAFPVALGFVVAYKGFIADTRVTIRPTYRQTALRDQAGSALTNWDLGAMVGFEF
jgi:hypothetical protein